MIFSYACDCPCPIQSPKSWNSRKCISKSEKCHFSPPQKTSPKANKMVGKVPFWGIQTRFSGVFGPFDWLRGAIFLGGQDGIFWTSKCTFWFQDFGFCMGPGRSQSYAKKECFQINFFCGPGFVFLPSVRRSTQAPTIKAVKRTVAIKGMFDNYKGRLFPLRRVRFPYGAVGSPCGGICSPSELL